MAIYCNVCKVEFSTKEGKPLRFVKGQKCPICKPAGVNTNLSSTKKYKDKD